MTTEELGEEFRKLTDAATAGDYGGILQETGVLLQAAKDVVDGFLHPKPDEVHAVVGSDPKLHQDFMACKAAVDRIDHPVSGAAVGAKGMDPDRLSAILTSVKSVLALIQQLLPLFAKAGGGV